MDSAEAQTARLTARDFVDTVVRLQPRVAAFDCDGTLWSGDVGMDFFDWEIEHGIVALSMCQAMRARHAEYKAGKVSEEDMCGEMVTMHQGLSDAELTRVATGFFEEFFAKQIFPEMRELIRQLQQAGCEVWAVSSSNDWLIRAGMKHFDIPQSRILSAKAEIEHDVITSRIVRIPSGPGKQQAIQEVVRKNLDAAFGNSRWDTEMLAMARHAFAVNPNPDLEQTARQQGWTVYKPNGSVR